MRTCPFLLRVVSVVAVAVTLLLCRSAAAPAKAPQAGEQAPDFALPTPEDVVVDLKSLVGDGPVVLVVLRGWPGYQCPLCARQVQDFVAQAARFEARGAKVVMIYPGPAEALKAHASEFLRDKNWPAGFTLLLDPDFTFTHAYRLRWDMRRETAYPATFILERGGRIRFAHVSQTHGNRLDAARALAALP